MINMANYAIEASGWKQLRQSKSAASLHIQQTFAQGELEYAADEPHVLRGWIRALMH